MAKLGRCPRTGKVMFTSWDQCIRRILINSSKRGVALRAYQCPFCRHFHETKKREWSGSAA
ncbi:MAG TPA: hypothetical protein VFH56_14300 [Acidimicrobiales bacterium]|nr:hypothetical protein [Acidimicrobiales bacterium]